MKVCFFPCHKKLSKTEMIFDWLQKGEEHEEMGKKGGKKKEKEKKKHFCF